VCLSRARLRSGRSVAVHRAAKDAAQVPMLLYGSGETHWSLLLFLRRKKVRRRGEFRVGRRMDWEVWICLLKKTYVWYYGFSEFYEI